MPAQGSLTGELMLHGRLTGRSGAAFSHVIYAKDQDRIRVEGKVLYATVDYDGNFKKEILQDHYRDQFLCLTRGMKKDC